MSDNEFITEDILKEFVAEFREHIQSLELNLLALEKDPGNLTLLNEIFRPVHTLKGAASFLGFSHISEFSHKLENLLDGLRKGKRTASLRVIDVLLAGLDAIKKCVDDVAQGGNGSGVDTTAIIAEVDHIMQDGGAAPAAATPTEPVSASPVVPPPAGSSSVPAPNAAPQPGGVPTADEREVFCATAQQHMMNISQSLEDREIGTIGSQAFENMCRAVHSFKLAAGYMRFTRLVRILELQETLFSRVRQRSVLWAEPVLQCSRQFLQACAAMASMIRSTGNDDADTTALAAAYEALEREVPPAADDSATKPGAARRTVDLNESTIRVNMQKLDLLVNLIGELIINKSRFDLLEKRLNDGTDIGLVARELRDAANFMGRITEDLHTAVMDTRMVTIGTLFQRFPRVVREVGKKKQRDLLLRLEGEDTEIDKTIVEEINDPLLHLIRNAADHGIESPEERAAAGKPVQGTVYLRAYHESGNVVIEVEDDGKGINIARVREKAIANGLITAEQAVAMSELEVMNLIFAPGFSTAEVVTDISGRGVGMDVVKTNIEKLRGKIHLQSEAGKGTKVILKLPLTMAIIEALMVEVGTEIFAIPLLAVNEVLEIQEDQINTIGGKSTVMLHGRVISAVRLGEVLKIPHAAADGKLSVVVLEVKNINGSGTTQLGFFVDTIEDKQKIVIKALDESFVKMNGFSGVTILGNGRTALILEPVEIVDQAIHGSATFARC